MTGFIRGIMIPCMNLLFGLSTARRLAGCSLDAAGILLGAFTGSISIPSGLSAAAFSDGRFLVFRGHINYL